MRYLNNLTYTLIILGALNWGLVGFFKLDLVAALFGDMSALARLTYAIIGLAGITHLALSNQKHRAERGYAH